MQRIERKAARSESGDKLIAKQLYISNTELISMNSGRFSNTVRLFCAYNNFSAALTLKTIDVGVHWMGNNVV